MYSSFCWESLPSTALSIIRVQVVHNHTQEHDVEIRALLTSHTLYKFLIRKSQKENPVDFFKHKRDGLQQQRTTMSKHSTVSNQCLEASYVVAHRIELGKPHTIAETLI